MNPWDDDDILTDIWKQQARKTWEDMLSEKIKIKYIISSNLSRARETAEIIAEEIWFFGQILQDSRLREQDGWVFKWRKRDDIKEEFHLKNDLEFRKIFKSRKYNKIEDVKEFDSRVGEFLRDVSANYWEENILLVWHSGTSRALLRNVQDLDFEYIHFEMSWVKNAQIIDLKKYKA